MKHYPSWAQIIIFVCVLIILSILFFVNPQKPSTTEKESPKVNIENIDVAGDIVAGNKIIIPPSQEDNQNDSEKKQTIAKIKINRLLYEYNLNIEKLRQEYDKEFIVIVSNMNERGLLRSSIHIQAQKNLTVETKNKINELFAKLTRDIEDVLLEHYDSHILKEIPKLQKEYNIYISLQEKINNFYRKMEGNVQNWELKINGP